MKENSSAINWLTVMKLGGALVAFCIGSGYATGQEVLQFFASYGFWAFGAVAISLAIYFYMALIFMRKGQELTEIERQNIFGYYFGIKIGRIFDWFSTGFCYAVFIVMLSGAGAIFNEYYKLNTALGASLMGILGLVIVIMGLTRIINVIGFIGPLIILFTCLVGVVSLFANLANLAQVNEAMQTVSLTKAAPNWWLSGILYPCFMVFLLAPVLPQMGAVAKNKKETFFGGTVGVIAFHFAICFVVLAMLANATLLEGKLVPMLVLAADSSPILASLFAIIILSGIFTTVIPLLYSTTLKFVHNEKSSKFKLLALGLTAFGIFGGIYLPFDKLVNIVYSFVGYLGIAVLIALAIKEFAFKKNRKSTASTTSTNPS